MQAIILAAGMGLRLGNYTKDNTKCMVEINGIKLIDHTLTALRSAGIIRVILVVGYKKDALKQWLHDRYSDMNITFIDNDRYEKTNNIYSLWLAKNELLKDDTILLESDVIFETSIIQDLLVSEYNDLVVVAKHQHWMDGTVTILDNNKKIISFIDKKNFNRGHVSEYYKTVNIYKFSKGFLNNFYLPFLEAYIQTMGHDAYYEQVLRVVSYMERAPLYGHVLTDEKWYEIDDAQDLDIATALFATGELKFKLLSERYGGYWRFPQIKDFCYLVNPYFPTQEMNDEIKDNFNDLIQTYPSGMIIQTLLAEKVFHVSHDYILAGNGAAELIQGLAKASDQKFGIFLPTFNEYLSVFTNHRLAEYFTHNNEFRYTVDDLKNAAISCEGLILVNPDNPSGNFIDHGDMIDLLNYMQKANKKLIVDESFIDFAGESKTFTLLTNDIIEKYPNLVVIKSISKSYGVPGLRLGVLAASDQQLLAAIRKELPIWNINSFAEFFMQIFDKYKKDYETSCIMIAEERDRFFYELQKISFLRVIPSAANYFLCEVLNGFTAHSLAVALADRFDILIKDLHDKRGINGEYIRLTVRHQEENDTIINTLIEIDDFGEWDF